MKKFIKLNKLKKNFNIYVNLFIIYILYIMYISKY